MREDIYLMTNTAAADWIMVAYGPVDAYYDAKTGAKKEWAKISVSSTTKALIDELRGAYGMTANELISDALKTYRKNA